MAERLALFSAGRTLLGRKLLGWILLATALSSPLWGAAGAEEASASGGCKTLLAKGQLETRRALFPEALAYFEQAVAFAECARDAQLGMAEVYNGMNRHREALRFAQSVLETIRDDEVAALAYYQQGVALDVRGRRFNAKRQQAVDAFKRSVEVSGGEYEPAIRALLRIYRETDQAEELARLEARFPQVRTSTRAEQVRQMQAHRKQQQKKKPPAGTGEAAPSNPTSDAPSPDATEPWTMDCATGERLEDQPLDASVSVPTAEDWKAGMQRPEKLEAVTPQYSESTRLAKIQGVVVAEVWIDEQGTPRSARLVRSLHPDLDANALAAFCKSRWRPAQAADGTPIAIAYQLTTNFSIQ